MIDIGVAMYDLLDMFTPLDPNNILRAWPNRTATPPEEYAIITDMGTVRRGTNASDFDFDAETEEDGQLSESVLHNSRIQFDFIGKNAKQYAENISVLGRSATLCDFLAQYEIEPLFAEDLREATFVDGSQQYAKQYSITLTISYWTTVTASVGWFDNVIITTEVVQ